MDRAEISVVAKSNGDNKIEPEQVDKIVKAYFRSCAASDASTDVDGLLRKNRKSD